MNTSRLIILGLLWIVVSCVQKKQKSFNNNAVISDSLVYKPEMAIEREMTINNRKIDWTGFDKVFAHVDSENEFEQILGITMHGNDSIDFQLFCSSRSCEMEVHGTATANYPDGDPEIDEDEDGAYPADQFLFETGEYVVSVRIDSENKSKARFIYSPKSAGDDECDPNNNLIMKAIDIH